MVLLEPISEIRVSLERTEKHPILTVYYKLGLDECRAQRIVHDAAILSAVAEQCLLED